MARWIQIVNLKFDPLAFRAYAKSLSVEKSAWKPKGIVLHNTADPDLAAWAKHSWQDNLEILVEYYRDTMKWHAGPHLFVAPEGICCFTPIATPGVHSPSFNNTHLGVEMVGNYVLPKASDDFQNGKGGIVHLNAISAVATLCEVFHLDSASLKLHREDPKTTHDCPGHQVDKTAFIQAVHNELLKRKPVVA